MERPERPSRHKLNRVKIPFRPNFSSDSESELNDSDFPIHISYCQSTPSESGAAGPSTSTSGQLIGQSNADAPSSDMTDFVPSTNTIPLTRPEAEESQAEPQDQLDPIRGKRPAPSSTAASVIFESVDSIIGSSTAGSAQEPDTLERPANPSQPQQRSSFIIRPRSFCHIDNTIRPPALKFRRLNGPIDLTPGSTSRDTSNQGIGLQLSGGSIWGNSGPSTSSVAPNWPKRRPLLIPPRAETAQSSILRHFDDMMCSTSPIIRRRIKPYTIRNSSLDDYCDLVGNFLFNCPASETSSQRSPERPGVAGPQTSATADIINRHISTTPDLISNEPSSIINDFSTLFDPQPIRNNIENEPVEQGSDDVIVVESPDINASPETYMVASSRTPTPTETETPPPESSAAAAHKQDKAQSNPSKEVPMTLDELNQSLVTLLECPVCLDHATPPIYQCCKGHILCQSCHPRLTTCPICRSRLPGDRNSVMEKVAEKLMYPCKNTVTGCSKMLKLVDKQKHEEGCGFRHYACILSSCHWKGYKPELVVHLQSNHPDKLISGAVKELLVPVPGSVPDGGGMLITHHWIQAAHNEVFNVIFHVDLYKRIMKGCVIYVGAPEKAEKFSYIFELKQQVAPFRRLLYSRTTHADTIRPCNDFSINIDVARLYRDYILHAIPVHISIVQNQNQ